jgi:hypothetical protein
MIGKRSNPLNLMVRCDPVGCANDFNWLGKYYALQKVPCPENVRRIRSRAVPGKVGNCSRTNRGRVPARA